MHRNGSRLLTSAALVALACSSAVEAPPGAFMGTGGATAGGLQTGGAALTGGASSSMGGGTVVNGSGGAVVNGSGGAVVNGSGGASAGGAPPLGAAGSGNNTAKGGATNAACTPWPAPVSTQTVSSTIPVSGSYDGGLKRFVGSGDLGSSGQDEDQPPIFELANNATLKNVIIGAPAADGIHCSGACTLENVWWEDVGEDAATFRGSSSSQQSFVRCGGAKNASDKVFQHNGAGTLTIQNFTVETFGKLYRSCGNCSTQYERHVILQDVTAKGGPSLVGVNTNYNDTAKFTRITVTGSVKICERFTGNDTGAEPTSTGSGPDAKHCLYTSADITQK